MYHSPNRSYNEYVSPPSQKHMQLGSTDWTSLYIPYLDSSYTKEYLAYALEMKYNIGKISHIDFVKTGRMDEVSAFVHFEVWYNNEFTQFLRPQLEKYNKYYLSYFYRYFNSLPNVSKYVGESDNFVLMINRSPRRSASISTLSSSDEFEISDLSLRRETSLSSNLDTHIIDRLERRVELLEEQLRALLNK